MSTNYNYMLTGAKDSRYNSRQWFLYLRKVITREKIKLSNEDIVMLLKSDELTMYQKVTLKRAVIVGTPTHERVVSLNEKAKLRHVELLKRRLKNNQLDEQLNDEDDFSL